jgi:pimeloyl-ACP methyl ester carboxylesterase
MPTSDSFQTTDGQAIMVWNWPSVPGRPHLHWAHATGFHARTYLPLLNELSQYMNVTAWDMRGHGAGLLDNCDGWQLYYHDLAELMRDSAEPIWVAGHSVGGMTSLAAAAQCPEKVAGILLVEPVIVSGGAAAGLSLAKKTGLVNRLGIVSGASNRRQCFPSKQEAFVNYRSKHTFRKWPDEWLSAYVEHGLVETADNQVCLACTPAWESTTFANADHSPWGRLSSLRLGPSVSILAAEKGSAFSESARRKMCRQLPQAEIIEVPNSSHFLPMEHTQLVEQWIRERVTGAGT